MSEDIHGTFSADISDKASWRDGPVFKTLEALRPWLQWLVIVVMFFGGMYLYQRDTNTQQTVSVADTQKELLSAKRSFDDYKEATEKRFKFLEDKVLTRELYEAYRAADTERMMRIEKSIEAIAQRP